MAGTATTSTWAARSGLKLLRRPLYVFWLCVIALGLFSVTVVVSRMYAQKQHSLSSYWADRGARDLGRGDALSAISDYRTALLYSREDNRYEFALAEALAAANRTEEARSYFLTLLEDRPGNGPVNLQLARLAVKSNDIDRALRYYNGAIYGAWPSDAIANRQSAREELVQFLLDKKQNTQARGELLTYTAEMPKTPQAQLWAARAFAKLGDDENALSFYQSALRADRHDPDALVEAGAAAFRLSRYAQALEFFRRAEALHTSPSTSHWLQLTSSVIELNPFAARIPWAERKHRLLLAMDIADRRLRQCSAQHRVPAQADNTTNPATNAPAPTSAAKNVPAATPLDNLRTQWLQMDTQLRRTHDDSELMDVMSPVSALVLLVEQQSACGTPTAADEAMLRVYSGNPELQP